MVMVTYWRDFQRRGISGDGAPLESEQRNWRLGSPPLRLCDTYRLG